MNDLYIGKGANMDLNQYLSMFIDEANDHLQALNEHMLELENSPDDVGIVQIIFRSAHTLKGMSATMGFEDLASLTHQMENVLDMIRNHQLKMDEFIFDTLFRSLDSLEAMVSDITQGGEGKADVTQILAALKSIETGEYRTASSQEKEGAGGGEEASGETLDEFQRSILEQSLESGMNVYHLRVRLRDDCVLKAVRAYMVFQVLGQHGEVVKSTPPAQDIEQDKFDSEFTVFFVSTTEQAELEREINQVSELESVTRLDERRRRSRMEPQCRRRHEGGSGDGSRGSGSGSGANEPGPGAGGTEAGSGQIAGGASRRRGERCQACTEPDDSR